MHVIKQPNQAMFSLKNWLQFTQKQQTQMYSRTLYLIWPGSLQKKDLFCRLVMENKSCKFYFFYVTSK